MTTELLTQFFMWCAIINGSLLIFWTLSCMLMPDLVYRLQSRWFPISREHYHAAMYAFIGLFKIVFLVFNVAPYIALRIIA